MPDASPLSRAATLTSTALRTGLSELGRDLRAGHAPSTDLLGRAATRGLLAGLLELRGAAVKVAQFLSLETDLLPEALQRDFAQAQRNVTPLSPESATMVVRRELGGRIEDHFAAFDAHAFAAASLGQVHAARTRDGVDVVVKVQFPGVKEGIGADILTLSRLVKRLPSGGPYVHLVDEVRERLLEECDYLREARETAWFHERLHSPDLAVPQPILSLTTTRVLTATRVPGRHLEDWLATDPPEAARSKAAQRLYDNFHRCVHVHQRIHGDPNPGNLLFREGGAVGLVDFGCTRVLPPDYGELVAHIWRAAAARDDALAHETYLQMGLFRGLEPSDAWRLDREALKPFRDWLGEPLRHDRFRFGGEPTFVAEGRQLFGRMLEANALAGIRPEFILVNRTLYGLYRVFERLGATVVCDPASALSS